MIDQCLSGLRELHPRRRNAFDIHGVAAGQRDSTCGATPAQTRASLQKRTRPYPPQTNGKTEPFHGTMADGWAFKRFYNTEEHDEQLCQHGSTGTTTE